jgi:hypothetical protein
MPRDGVLASGQTSSVVQWKISMVRPAVIAAPVSLHESVRWFDSPVCGIVGLVKYGSVFGPARKDVLMCCRREDYLPHVAGSPQACWMIQILHLDTRRCGSPCHALSSYSTEMLHCSFPAGDYQTQNQNPTSTPTTPLTLNSCYSDTKLLSNHNKRRSNPCSSGILPIQFTHLNWQLTRHGGVGIVGRPESAKRVASHDHVLKGCHPSLLVNGIHPSRGTQGFGV